MQISCEQGIEGIESGFGLNVRTIEGKTELYRSALLDSFSVADLVLFREEAGNSTVEPHKIVVENINSVSRIVDFAQRKQTAMAE